MSLAAVTELTDGALRDQVAALLGAEVRAIEPVSGGGNNRLHRVTAADGRAYALKRYMHHRSDLRDRLGTEFIGLSFLWRHGVCNVPCPVVADRALQIALYHWAEGAAVTTPGPADVDLALSFAADLYALARDTEAADLPLASEACLSAADIATQIRRRLGRLQTVDDGALGEFLAERFLPCLDDTWLETLAGCDAIGLDADRPLALSGQTLSPSDFGFHNALRDPLGDLVFLDFEYFGRDDPVKLTADFLLHPGMALDHRLRQRFLDGCARIYGADPEFAARLRLYYPMFALRWCLIVLNEFLPDHWARRDFARPGEDRATARQRQLDKAEAMLARVDDVNGRLFIHA